MHPDLYATLAQIATVPIVTGAYCTVAIGEHLLRLHPRRAFLDVADFDGNGREVCYTYEYALTEQGIRQLCDHLRRLPAESAPVVPPRP